MASNKERALGNLVTDIAKGPINYQAKHCLPMRQRERSAKDHGNEQECERSGDEPDYFGAAVSSALRNVLIGRSKHSNSILD